MYICPLAGRGMPFWVFLEVEVISLSSYGANKDQYFGNIDFSTFLNIKKSYIRGIIFS